MDDKVESSLKGVAKGASVLFIGTFISKAIMYFYRIAVARYLGSAEYGILSLGLAAFWVTVSLSNLSLGSGIQRFATKHLDDESRVKGVFVSAVSMNLPLSLLGAASLFLLSPFIATEIFHDPSVGPYLRVFALAVPFQVLYYNGANLVKAFKKMEYIALVDKIYRSLATLLVTVALIFAGYGLMGAVVAQLFAILTSAVLILYFTEKKVFPLLKARSGGFRNYSELFHYSYPLMLGSIIGLVTGWTDTLMLGFFDTTSNVGIYNAALPTAQLLNVFAMSLGTILFPTVSSLYSDGKKEESVRVTSTSLKWISSAALPLLAIMIFFANPLLKLLFGNAYTAGSIALSVLAVAYFTRAMTSYAGSYIKSEDRTKLSMLNSSITAVSNFLLNLYLIPQYSTAGAGIATATSLAIGGLAAVIEVRYLFGVQPFRVRKLVPQFLSSLLSISAVYLLVKQFYDPTPVWVLFPAFLLFGVMYAALFLLLGGLEDDDVMVLNAVDERIPADLSLLRKWVKKLAR